MPARAFRSDIERLSRKPGVHGIIRVDQGRSDGEFTVMVEPSSGEPFELFITIPEISEYPEGHWLQIEIVDRHMSDQDRSSLSSIQDNCIGRSLDELLSEIAAAFIHEDPSDVEFDAMDAELDGAFHPHQPTTQFTSVSAPMSSFNVDERNRIRHDLQAATDAGFKVAALGGAAWLFGGSNCYLSLSVRMSELGISLEAQRAWQIHQDEYLVLLIQYPEGYKTFEQIANTPSPALSGKLSFRIGRCFAYKPDLQEAIDAFTKLVPTRAEEQKSLKTLNSKQDGSKFRSVFISRSLEELMNCRFAILCKFRVNGMSWSGAEKYLDLKQASLGALDIDETVTDRFMEDGEKVNATYPSIVTADHIMDNSAGLPLSLPLLANQFLLRHFVRCTEFCLVCHNKFEDDLEAIMPYVCDRPLCLHQFMALGFGPSIENEICAGPLVVDLLLSFCYVSCQEGRLSDLPKGLNWQVPPPSYFQQLPGANPYQPIPVHSRFPGSNPNPPENSKPYESPPPYKLLEFDIDGREIIFPDGAVNPVKPGDWLVIITQGSERPRKYMHCRVLDTAFFPTVRVSEPVFEGKTSVESSQSAHETERYPRQQGCEPTTPAASPTSKSGHVKTPIFYKYEHNFQSFSDSEQRASLCHLLNTLPEVTSMKVFLTDNPNSTLADWRDRISPAALGALRWVVASCRACIMQESNDERVFGMRGWLQFRFAMGAPDKERRFLDAVQTKKQALDLTIPTLFAWHGSRLSNWHSIIRQGLHFDHIMNGRAFGNGVYFSLEVATSQGYTGGYTGHDATSWPLSVLNIASALSLNEIVNAPREFVNTQPHLVVAQLDWIQTRYLFVQCRRNHNPILDKIETPPPVCRPQDTHLTPRGVSGFIIIPDHSQGAVKFGNKRRKTSKNGNENVIGLENDIDDDDRVMLILEEASEALSSVGKGGKTSGAYITRPKPTGLTLFEPGKLDYKTLPILTPPIWATSAASKRLMTDFQHLIQVQTFENLRGRLHELGWYSNPDKMENIYQWIVELHSFEDKLPLAKDMKRAGLQSIVLELRFGKDYPMIPPFVRVVRPRFLPFGQGGGGNVTLGGAMCMELLTNTGWSSASTIESVLLQVRCAVTSVDPPARLQITQPAMQDYTVGEAIEAYERACRSHGWQIPAGFREMAQGGV